MSAHVRIASDNARMGLPETSLGLIPAMAEHNVFHSLLAREGP